jgi:hypothetical protein
MSNNDEEVKYDIEELPPVLELDEDKMFHDDEGNMSCLYCNNKLVPIGNSRINGKDHIDWNTRKLHKKCYRELSEITDGEFDLTRLSIIDGLLCSFNGCNDDICECRKCKLCNTRIPKNIALCKTDLCINCHINEWCKINNII